MRIEMEEREWQAVLAVLAQAPWGQVNGLIMKIGEQMRAQAQPVPTGKPNGAGEAKPERPDG